MTKNRFHVLFTSSFPCATGVPNTNTESEAHMYVKSGASVPARINDKRVEGAEYPKTWMAQDAKTKYDSMVPVEGEAVTLRCTGTNRRLPVLQRNHEVGLVYEVQSTMDSPPF
jgi:hypothetical protein